MNKITLIGRLTQDPTCQYTNNQVAYMKNTIAVQRNYKNASGEYDTDFINVTAYRNQAELITKHFVKGDRIGIIGTLQMDKWTDQNGNNRITANVVIEEIEFLQEKKTPTQEAQPQKEEFDVSEDDLPF